MDLDNSHQAALRRQQWIHMATSEAGRPVKPVVHVTREGNWTVTWDHSDTPVVSQAMRLLMIREGHPEMLACDACVAKQGPGWVWVDVARDCHHLDWMVTSGLVK